MWPQGSVLAWQGRELYAADGATLYTAALRARMVLIGIEAHTFASVAHRRRIAGVSTCNGHLSCESTPAAHRLSIVVTTCAAQFRGRTRWDCPPVLSPNPTPALLPHAHCFRTSHANLHMVRLLRMRARLGTAASLPRQYGPTVRECRRRACAVADIAWRAHKDRSGFDGAWTADPLKFDRAWVPFCSAPPWAYLRRAESVGSR